MNKKHIINKIIISFFIFIFLSNFFKVYCDDIDNDENSINDISDINNLTSIETSSKEFSELDINARSCIVLDRLSKNILYGKNEYNRVKMASTTKIMTAIIVIENMDLNQIVEISKKSAGTGGSRLGLKAGDKITIRDLLYGLLLCSGNDAAVALAETSSGSIQEFSKLMNSKAKDLNLNNTHFESPHGLDSDNHYTTAYELSLLSDYALENPTFKSIVGTKNYTITVNGYPKTLSNTNELLGNLEGVYGIKTGFTNGANRCLVTACKRDDMDIICVVLGCDTKKFRTKDSIKLIEYAFKNFEYVNIEQKISEKLDTWKKENLNYFCINKGTLDNIEVQYSKLEKPIIPIKKSDIPSIKINILVNKYLEAPIFKDTSLGKIEVTTNNNTILSCEMLSANTIKKKNIVDYIFELLKRYPLTVNSCFEITL